MAHYDYMTQRDQLSPHLALLFAGVLVLAGCSAEFNGKEAKDGADKKGEKARNEKAVLVELAEVKRGMIESILERSAPLEAAFGSKSQKAPEARALLSPLPRAPLELRHERDVVGGALRVG